MGGAPVATGRRAVTCRPALSCPRQTARPGRMDSQHKPGIGRPGPPAPRRRPCTTPTRVLTIIKTGRDVYLMPDKAMVSTNRLCTRRNATTIGAIARTEPAMIIP
jgi:hypothetical protein